MFRRFGLQFVNATAALNEAVQTCQLGTFRQLIQEENTITITLHYKLVLSRLRLSHVTMVSTPWILSFALLTSTVYSYEDKKTVRTDRLNTGFASSTTPSLNEIPGTEGATM